MSASAPEGGAPAGPDITHDETAGRFETVVSGLRCVCDYHRRGDVLVFTHTEVPPALAGRGIAAALVAHALDWARAQGLKVQPLCSYVAVYMRRHRETQDLLAR